MKQQSIVHTAEFEHANLANEDMIDATPRPPFTPKPWPPPRNRKNAKLVPITESSDVKMGDDFDKASFVPVPSEQSVAEDESAIKSDDPTPPSKKQKAQVTEKATGTVGAKPGASAKVAKKKKKVDRDKEIVPASDEEQTPKPKKVKVKVRDEINIAAKNMEENEVKGSKYGDMVKSMSSKRAEQSSGMPASKAPLQLQAVGGGKKLKREGAIANINALYGKVTPANHDQSLNHSQDNMTRNDINNVMDIDNR